MKRIFAPLLATCIALFFLFLFSTFQVSVGEAVTDTTSPTSAATIARNRYGPGTFSATTSIQGTATDNSAINNVTAYIQRQSDDKYFNGSSWGTSPISLTTSVNKSGSGATWVYNANSLVNQLDEGITYKVTPLAVDTSNNSKEGTDDSFVWDETSPDVTINNPQDGDTVGTNFSLSVTSSESSTCQYRQDNGNFSTLTSSLQTSHTKAFVLSNGDYTLEVKCTDEAGNVSALEETNFTVNRNSNSSGSGSSSNSNKNKNTNSSSVSAPAVSLLIPGNLSGKKPRNQTIVCRAIDTNTSNAGFDLSRTKITINNTNVNVTVTNINQNTNANQNNNANTNTNKNKNSNTNSSKGSERIIDISYTPSESSLFAAESTVEGECEVWNKNGKKDTESFRFDVGTEIASLNSNTNAGTNTNANVSNANTNASSGTSFFTDTKDHWAKDYAEKLHNVCGVDGLKDETGALKMQFAPDQPITRAELVAMVLRCKKIDVSSLPVSLNPFSDVPSVHWAVRYIIEGNTSGLIDGYSDKTFRPDQPVLRAESWKIMLLGWLALADIRGGESSFTDTVAGAWYMKFLNFLVLNQILSGYTNPDGTPQHKVGPERPITRAEVSKILSILIEKY